MEINHIAMYVTNLESAKMFFEKYFNVKANNLYYNKKTNFKSYFLSFDRGARLEIMNKPDISSFEEVIDRKGFIHIAISVGSKEKVDILTKQLENDGYNIISKPRVTGDGYYESCIIGIENNQIEVTI